MNIGCACYFDDPDGWWYEHKGDFSQLDTKRRQRCYCCRTLIDIGADCGKLHRERHAKDEIEDRIYQGDTVPLAAYYLCEECYGLMLSVEELGACVFIRVH